MLEKWAGNLKKGIFPTSRVAVIVGEVALAVLVIIPVVDIIMRRLINKPLPGAYELSEFILGVMVFTGMSYCAVKGAHVTVDVVTSRFSSRVQKVLDVVIYLFTWVVTGLISWQLLSLALTVKARHETSAILGIPVYPFELIAAIGFAIMTLVFLVYLDKVSAMVKN